MGRCYAFCSELEMLSNGGLSMERQDLSMAASSAIESIRASGISAPSCSSCRTWLHMFSQARSVDSSGQVISTCWGWSIISPLFMTGIGPRAALAFDTPAWQHLVQREANIATNQCTWLRTFDTPDITALTLPQAKPPGADKPMGCDKPPVCTAPLDVLQSLPELQDLFSSSRH